MLGSMAIAVAAVGSGPAGATVVAHAVVVRVHIALGVAAGGVAHPGFLAAAEAVTLGRGKGGDGAHREQVRLPPDLQRVLT